MAARDAAKFFLSRFATCHGSHRDCATGLGKLWRHGPANEAGVPAVCPARLHALLSRTKTRLSAVFNGLWYAAQRTSSYGRKALAKQKIRRKLGDYGQLWATKFPPKPRGMWRRTHARRCAALAFIEYKLAT